MNSADITMRSIIAYEKHLRSQERCEGTVAKYLRDIAAFTGWLGERELNKEAALEWKRLLAANGLRPATINSKLAALNGFFAFCGREDCRIKFLKIQRQTFRRRDKELTEAEYRRLVNCAYDKGRLRLALLLETLGATGIRVSELKFITVEAAGFGRTDIALKGKIRTILLPAKLCRKLLKYARKNKIASGEIFLTGSGRSLSRKQIWAEMKALCKAAGVSASKVFPHNLRHMFAAAYYRVSRDIVQLADVLGHASIETTRIYLLTTGIEHIRRMERLGFVI